MKAKKESTKKAIGEKYTLLLNEQLGKGQYG